MFGSNERGIVRVSRNALDDLLYVSSERQLIMSSLSNSLNKQSAACITPVSYCNVCEYSFFEPLCGIVMRIFFIRWAFRCDVKCQMGDYPDLG